MNSLKHGHTLGGVMSPTYISWGNMTQRCTNIKNDNYPRYGGKGVKIDPRWVVFKNFLADMGERPPGCTIDRVDNAGDYTPGNCRWATKQQQQRNTKTPCTNTSGERGVDLVRSGVWRARIKNNGRTIHLGQYPTIEEAVAARQQGEKDHWQ